MSEVEQKDARLTGVIMVAGKYVHYRNAYGFTYVVMLCSLVIFGLGLAALGQSWSMASQRMKENELIQIGNEVVWAIGDYYQHPPGTVKTFPTSLQDLVEDKRFVGTRRHLRKIYRDPFTLKTNWGLITNPQGGISGIYSINEASTLRQNGVVLYEGSIVTGKRYMNWKFTYTSKL